MNTVATQARVAAELLVSRGDIINAMITVERALVSAPPEYRPDLEEVREWLGDLLPARSSLVGERTSKN